MASGLDTSVTFEPIAECNVSGEKTGSYAQKCGGLAVIVKREGMCWAMLVEDQVSIDVLDWAQFSLITMLVQLIY